MTIVKRSQIRWYWIAGGLVGVIVLAKAINYFSYEKILRPKAISLAAYRDAWVKHGSPWPPSLTDYTTKTNSEDWQIFAHTNRYTFKAESISSLFGYKSESLTPYEMLIVSVDGDTFAVRKDGSLREIKLKRHAR